MFLRSRQILKFLTKISPILVILLLLYSVFLSIRIVKTKQMILSMSKDVCFIERDCVGLKAKTLDLNAKIMAMHSIENISKSRDVYAYSQPKDNQIFKATRADLNDFAHSGEKHFAMKSARNATSVAYNDFAKNKSSR